MRSDRPRGAAGVGPLLRRPIAARAAVPVEAHHRGVVLQVAAGGPEDGRAELVHDLPRVQVGAAGQGLGDVEVHGVALLHAVGQQHYPVTRFQRKLLDVEALAEDDPERRFDAKVDLLDLSIAQA